MKLYPDQDPVTEASTYESSRRTGFGENWSNALGLAMAEDLPVTSRMISTTVESQRNRKVLDYVRDGSIPMGASQFYAGDPNGLAGYARDVIGLEGIPTDEDFQEQRLQEYAAQREMSEGTFANQTTMGFVGEMFGYAHAMALDPLYASSFLTGYGTAATLGQAVLRVGVTEAAIETVAQIPKMSWKEEIGADYGGAEAVAQIAFAGLGSAGMTAFFKGVGGPLLSRLTYKDLTVEQATEVLEGIAKDNPELDPILHTLRQADPTDNALKVMEADEAVDIRMADQGAKSQADVKGDLETKAPEIEAAEEEIFAKRQPTAPEEGVPRGTPKEAKPDTRHPLVKEADDMVVELDDQIRIMEECF